MKKLTASDFNILSNEEMVDLFPPIFIEMVECIGLDNTLLVVNSFGGLDFPMPRGFNDCKRGQKLIDCLGHDVAMRFMGVFGGGRLYIPRCDDALREVRNRKFCKVIDDAIRAGHSKTNAVQSYAYEFGLGERNAYKILKRYKPARFATKSPKTTNPA